MQRANVRSLAALVLCVLVLDAGPGASVRVRDLMPSLYSVLSLAKTGDRVAAFKERVLYPNPSLYNNGYALLDDPHIAWYLASLSNNVPKLRATNVTVGDTLPTTLDAFERAFPQFDPTGVVVYLMPSMGSFDGMTKDVDGKHGLLLGIDNIAQEPGPVGVLVDHELFHVYHHAINPVFFPTKTENDLYRYGIYREVWAEGLATYVSQQLNRTTAAAALFSSDLADLPATQTQQLACFVEQRFDSRAASDQALLFDGGRHPDGLPARGGYYIGYLAAKDLGTTRSLAQLAAMNGDSLTEVLRADVHARCAGSVTSSQPRT